MSKDWMFNMLEHLGFRYLDAEVYIYLLQNNAQKVGDIAHALITNKSKLYRNLEKLKQKGIVSGSQEKPTRFSAVPFNKILDQFIKTNKKEATRMEQKRKQILSLWNSIILADNR